MRSASAASWGTAAWLEESTSWCRREVHAAGARLRGPLTPVAAHPWSTLWRAPTSRGDIWLKQTTPARGAEGSVQSACSRLAPDHVDAPLAVDRAAHRFLLRDAGGTMLAADPDTRAADVAPVAAMVADYARFQLLTLGGRAELETAGLTVWDPADAASEARRQAGFLHGLDPADPRHISGARAEQVMEALGEVQSAGHALAESPIPWAVEHGDLWAGNVVPPGEHASHRFIDLGDACWSHPFLSLVMPVVECRHRWAVPDRDDHLNLDDARLWAVLDAYLAHWADYAPMGELRATARLALRLAPLRRSLAWLTHLEAAGNPSEELDRYGQMPWTWLQDVTRPVRG